MHKITIKTPPISVNSLYRGRKYLTKEGKATKLAMGLEIASQWHNELITDDVAVNVLFYFKNKRMDIDNCLKATFDCISGIIWKDDRQITECHVYKMVDKENPRIEISII